MEYKRFTFVCISYKWKTVYYRVHNQPHTYKQNSHLNAQQHHPVPVFHFTADFCCSIFVRILRFLLPSYTHTLMHRELLEIKDNLTHDDHGRLTVTGFMEFYHLQTSSHVTMQITIRAYTNSFCSLAAAFRNV